MKRVSKQQKRLKVTNLRGAKRATEHLLLGDQHFDDRLAADKLRQFPRVPPPPRVPFPRDREVGFVGHFGNLGYTVQSDEEFRRENLALKQDAWYLRGDKRPGRKLRRAQTGILEVNLSIGTGYAKELARMVQEGNLQPARELLIETGKRGMEVLIARTGYKPGYLVCHPDSEATVSFHIGLIPIDSRHRLIGRSADGRRGRKGLRLLGHAFTTLMRHHEALADEGGLEEALVALPQKILKERDPDDWPTCQAMDEYMRQKLQLRPHGKDIIRRVDKAQKQAARDWLHRYQTSDRRTEQLRKQLARRRGASARLLARKSAVYQRQLDQKDKEIAELRHFKKRVRTWLEKVFDHPPLLRLLYLMARKVYLEFLELGQAVGLRISSKHLDIDHEERGR